MKTKFTSVINRIANPAAQKVQHYRGLFGSLSRACDYYSRCGSLDAVREGGRPNADIEVGHLSSSLCHLGNLVARVGRAIRFDPKKELVVGDEQADASVRRKYREDHWAAPDGG